MRRFLTTVIFAVVVMSSVAAQDGATGLTGNYSTLLDNDALLVVRVHYAAHETAAAHDHSRYPTVYVYLTNSGPVRFSHDDANPFTITRRPVKTGWFRVSPGRIERHEVANLGPVASDFLRVECKRIPLGRIPAEFRFTRDVDLTKSSVTTDYSSPEMVIRRYVVTASGVEHIAAETQSELLIAFTPTVVREGGDGDRKMAAGSVSWIKANTSFDLGPAGSAAAHVLAIRLLQ
jgi:hypothetical protein